MGDITIQSVSRPQGNLEAVSRPAQLRILLHVDGAGVVRLLKEVIVTQSPTSATDVWLFTESGRLAGKPVPRDLWSAAKAQRFATVAFDFEDNDGTSDSALQLTGRLALGDKVEGTLVLGPNHPSNPFRHKYHPDHANTGASAYEIRREVQIQVVTPPRESGGVVQILANYTETLRGLHRAGLTTQGLVQFTRISNAATLNP